MREFAIHLTHRPGEIGRVLYLVLVELDHVGAGLLQVERLGVDGLGKGHRELLIVLVELVLGLLAHRERAGQGDLRGMRRMGEEKFGVAQFNGARPAYLADDPRHRGRGDLLVEVQLEGRKKMPGEAFANGQRLAQNETLGAQEN